MLKKEWIHPSQQVTVVSSSNAISTTGYVSITTSATSISSSTLTNNVSSSNSISSLLNNHNINSSDNLGTSTLSNLATHATGAVTTQSQQITSVSDWLYVTINLILCMHFEYLKIVLFFYLNAVRV